MDRTHPDSGLAGMEHPEIGLAAIALRDYFAGQALMGMMASRSPTSPRFHPDDDAQYVYAVADAMLAAREVKP